MVELIWDGKYTPEGKKCAPVRLAFTFQDVEIVNESPIAPDDTRPLCQQLPGRNVKVLMRA